ncbi:maleylpyruvate isomerase N-terminal domain-containing protein [Glycomyces sambucus]|nr:maleylpyruvate isomerase N-terminal domain-containing protein [Glycomyces sambucus]
MMPPPPLTALAAETARMAQALDTVTAWDTPTRCTPWDAAALTAHVTGALARLDPMLDAPEPPAATVTAAGYFTPDHRYSNAANTTRVDTATSAARDAGPGIAAAFTTTAARVLARCATQPPGRRVTTRHGDHMTLTDFLTTRVVETAVHGIDLADALGTPRWTTPDARHTLTRLLLGPGHTTALAALGGDPVAFIAKATGRDPFPPSEKAEATRLGLVPLAFG